MDLNKWWICSKAPFEPPAGDARLPQQQRLRVDLDGGPPGAGVRGSKRGDLLLAAAPWSQAIGISSAGGEITSERTNSQQFIDMNRWWHRERLPGSPRGWCRPATAPPAAAARENSAILTSYVAGGTAHAVLARPRRRTAARAGARRALTPPAATSKIPPPRRPLGPGGFRQGAGTSPHRERSLRSAQPAPGPIPEPPRRSSRHPRASAARGRGLYGPRPSAKVRWAP